MSRAPPGRSDAPRHEGGRTTLQARALGCQCPGPAGSSVAARPAGGRTMAQRISRPIVSIANVARGISMGEINHDIEYESEDEVGTLASAFRGLIDYIKELSQAVGQLSE